MSIGIATVSAIAVAGVISYSYINSNKANDQSEMPLALRQTQKGDAIAKPTPINPQPINAIPAVSSEQAVTAPQNIIAPVDNDATVTKAEPVKELNPNVAPQTVTNTQKKPFISFGKRNDIVASNILDKPINMVKMPVAKTPLPPKIASANTINSNPKSGSIYLQALARQQSGDDKSAVKLMQQAADNGDVRAQTKLAKMYEQGDGVEKDLTKAREWTQKAASAGSRQAQHNLGVYYAEGDASKQDYAKAAESFKGAAKKGLTDSQYNLGAMAEQGLGVEKNEKDAYYWYSLAAKNGDADAQAKAKQTAEKLSEQDKAELDKKVTEFTPETHLD